MREFMRIFIGGADAHDLRWFCERLRIHAHEALIKRRTPSYPRLSLQGLPSELRVIVWSHLGLHLDGRNVVSHHLNDGKLSSSPAGHVFSIAGKTITCFGTCKPAIHSLMLTCKMFESEIRDLLYRKAMLIVCRPEPRCDLCQQDPPSASSIERVRKITIAAPPAKSVFAKDLKSLKTFPFANMTRVLMRIYKLGIETNFKESVAMLRIFGTKLPNVEQLDIFVSEEEVRDAWRYIRVSTAGTDILTAISPAFEDWRSLRKVVCAWSRREGGPYGIYGSAGRLVHKQTLMAIDRGIGDRKKSALTFVCEDVTDTGLPQLASLAQRPRDVTSE